MEPLVSICIPSYKQGHLVKQAIDSCLIQIYDNIEICVLNDSPDDGTIRLLDEIGLTLITRNGEKLRNRKRLKYYSSEGGSGTGGAFNKIIKEATGDYILLLCADDILTDRHIVGDIVEIFEKNRIVGHVSRWYHQFIDGDVRPVRAWRGYDVMELANNPSGLAFRKTAIEGCELSNNMFVEASTFVKAVLTKGWAAKILTYDTIAVRVHNSISQSKEYYLKRWSTSPIEEWVKVGGEALLKDYTSLIQIKNNFRTEAVIKEAANFIRLRPANKFSPSFWFFVFLSILCPRAILRRIPDLYRRTWGKWTTRTMYR